MSGILIVEDGIDTQIILKRTLSGVASQLTIASTATEAREFLSKYSFQLILLDIHLPDLNGLEFFNEIRSDEKTREIPVIFLTGRNEVTHKVTAFSMGAEDYIEKPFNPLELKARIEAKLRKASLEKKEQTQLIKGRLKLDAEQQRVQILSDSGGEPQTVRLTSREFRLLFHLARHEDHILSRQQLLDAIWGNESEVFDRTVDAHISVIRKKLGVCSSYIESISRQGYRFTLAQIHKKSAA